MRQHIKLLLSRPSGTLKAFMVIAFIWGIAHGFSFATASAQTLPPVTVDKTEMVVFFKRSEVTSGDFVAPGFRISAASRITFQINHTMEHVADHGPVSTSGALSPESSPYDLRLRANRSLSDGIHTGEVILRYRLDGQSQEFVEAHRLKYKIVIITGEYVDQHSYSEPTIMWTFQRPDKLAYFRRTSACPSAVADMTKVFPNTLSSEWRQDVNRWVYNGQMRELRVPFGILADIQNQKHFVSGSITTSSTVWICSSPFLFHLAPWPTREPEFDIPMNDVEREVLLLGD